MLSSRKSLKLVIVKQSTIKLELVASRPPRGGVQEQADQDVRPAAAAHAGASAASPGPGASAQGHWISYGGAAVRCQLQCICAAAIAIRS